MKRIKRLIYRIFDRYLRKKAIENHRKMWRWLAEHPDKRKFEYLEMHDPKADLHNDCYLCNYAKNKALYKDGNCDWICDYCPLCWGYTFCASYGAPFSEWAETASLKYRAVIAKHIAELLERKDR